ncbi:MAG: hypothetical protein JW940_11930 [Polyangiaceae bacterium]|nr:hypothetical protein [Polyangiaceae bacterium]
MRPRALASMLALLLVSSAALLAAEPARPAGLNEPLPALPKLPRIKLETPTEDAVERLNGLLERLVAPDPETRETAVTEIPEAGPDLVPAIDRQLSSIAESVDKDEMKRLLETTRRKAREDIRSKMRAAGDGGQVVTPDYLLMLIKYARPESLAWQQLVRLLGMSRMLVQIGGIRGARELVQVYVRFGEFLRVDTQLQIEKLGDYGVAALIEARRYPAAKIARWAERQLDTQGKAIAGEAIRTDDPEPLADILRALGRTRDPVAARIIISLANSERAQVREAARQAVVMLGDVAIWQLRDAFENVVGERPPRDWSWERTARELFARFDRLRLARVFAIFEEGLKARADGDLEKMRRAFAQVLARSPRFERAHEMASGLFEYASQADAAHRGDAIDALRRAVRINTDRSLDPGINSLLLTLLAEERAEGGVADQTLLRRAIELDSSNRRAKSLLSRLERVDTEGERQWARYGAAGVASVTALAAILVILLRRKRKEVAPGSPEKDPSEEEKDPLDGATEAAAPEGTSAERQETG